MSPIFKAIGAIGLLLATHAAQAAPADEARALYERFVTAQNSHDFAAVRATLLDSDRFLWVTDGRAVWGAATAVARMAQYHNNEVWRITPEFNRASVVEVSPTAAYITLPLTLEIGAKTGPDRFRFLVSALCAETPQGWRISALFTTLANPNE